MSDTATNRATENEILLTLILINYVDAILGERGLIPIEDVRSCTVDAVVSNRTTHFCLPADVIQKLGLRKVKTVDAHTKTGLQPVNIYEGVLFDVDGREGRYDCLELPTGQRPILGRLQLEDLGLKPDWENQCLQHSPIRV